MKKKLIIVILNLVSLFSLLGKSQSNQVYYPIEMDVQFGLNLPTTDSRSFYASTEKIGYKLNLSYFNNYRIGYTSGIQLNTISDYYEISVPLYFSYRTRAKQNNELYFGRIDNWTDVFAGFVNLIIPQRIKIDMGGSVGYIVGEKNNKNDISLNRHFYTSLDLCAKFCYTVNQFSIFISPEFNFILTSNYSYNGYLGRNSPVSYFKGMFGIGYAF